MIQAAQDRIHIKLIVKARSFRNISNIHSQTQQVASGVGDARQISLNEKLDSRGTFLGQLEAKADFLRNRQ